MVHFNRSTLLPGTDEAKGLLSLLGVVLQRNASLTTAARQMLVFPLVQALAFSQDAGVKAWAAHLMARLAQPEKTSLKYFQRAQTNGNAAANTSDPVTQAPSACMPVRPTPLADYVAAAVRPFSSVPPPTPSETAGAAGGVGDDSKGVAAHRTAADPANMASGSADREDVDRTSCSLHGPAVLAAAADHLLQRLLRDPGLASARRHT